MTNFIPAFLCVLCLFGLSIVGLGTGLGLIDPLLGLISIFIFVFVMVSASAEINE